MVRVDLQEPVVSPFHQPHPDEWRFRQVKRLDECSSQRFFRAVLVHKVGKVRLRMGQNLLHRLSVHQQKCRTQSLMAVDHRLQRRAQPLGPYFTAQTNALR